jgi:hypothetical protein
MVRDRFSLLRSLVADGSPFVDEMRIVSVIPVIPPPRMRVASTLSGRTDAEAHESTLKPTTTWPIVLETMPVSGIIRPKFGCKRAIPSLFQVAKCK